MKIALITITTEIELQFVDGSRQLHWIFRRFSLWFSRCFVVLHSHLIVRNYLHWDLFLRRCHGERHKNKDHVHAKRRSKWAKSEATLGDFCERDYYSPHWNHWVILRFCARPVLTSFKHTIYYYISRVTKSFFNVMEVIVFNMTLTCTVVIASSLFVIESSGGLGFEILVGFMNLCTILFLTFAYFFLSERITMRLLEIGDIIYNSPWYDRLTAKQQKLLVLGIQRAQREVRLTGLGLFDCSLPIFGSVCIAPQ